MWSEAHLAGVLPSVPVSCTQHVRGEVRIHGLTGALIHDGNLQLLEGFRIREGNCTEAHRGKVWR